jgi:hypothetical protein
LSCSAKYCHWQCASGLVGLTEDHPYKNTSPYRTAFRTANVNTCVKVSNRDISENLILAYCVCFADEIANVITQKELDYSRKNGVPPLSVKVKTDSIKSACAKKINLPH